ncbi:hypothetical protein ACFFIX_25230 [Metabacillus herbersteinensis]|uniref:Uncharacterized protein n=1 Tax=Metabacillus herbersteinensis TaxID=283816 RepID=A0ABV6GMG2_9BACI
MANYGIMITKKLPDGCTEVHVMDFGMARIWYVNFEESDTASMPDTLREYVRDNSDKIKSGRWHYSGTTTKK